MRFTTFNINGGSVDDAIQALDQDSSIAKMVGQREGDFLALQEITQPTERPNCIQTGGEEQRHLALCYSGEAQRGPEHKDGSNSIAACCEFNGESFQILTIWATKKGMPSYQKDVLRTLDFYSRWMGKQPTVVLGDFNLDPKIRGQGPDFYEVNARLNKLGLFSAYHMHSNTQHGHETNPTLLHNWGKGPNSGCFHIDFVYLPQSFLPRIKSVIVEPVFGLHEFSDHRPLTVEIE